MYNLLVLGLVLLVSQRSESYPEQPKVDCWNKPSDIVFILDSSSSIWPPDFQKQLDFVYYLVNQMDVGLGERQTRIGVMSFSDHAKININLSTDEDMFSLKQRISNIQQLKGKTNTGEALNLLISNMFQPINGARTGVKHIAIILTDGVSQEQGATQWAAKKCRDANIELFVIGIGRNIQYEELKGIASKPKSTHVFRTSSYSNLDRIKNNILILTCQTPTTPRWEPPQKTQPATTPRWEPPQKTQPECKNQTADVFFLLDSSSSILVNEFAKQINVLEHIIKNFDIGLNKMRVGASIFNDNYNPVMGLNEGRDLSEVLENIKRFKYVGGGTKIGKALQVVKREVFYERNKRPGVVRVLILFTDGQSSDPQLTLEQSKLLKQSGVIIFAIGVGPYVDQAELNAIASYPSFKYVYNFENFDMMLGQVGILSRVTCKVSREKTNNPTTPFWTRKPRTRPATTPFWTRKPRTRPVTTPFWIPQEKNQTDCTATRATDVLFLISSNHFGRVKTTLILEAMSRTIINVGKGAAFRFGCIFENCIPGQDVLLGETNQVFQYGTLRSLLNKTTFGVSSKKSVSNSRNIALVFLDNTVDLADPAISSVVYGYQQKGIETYVVAIGDGVDISLVNLYLVPNERIITIPSYEVLIGLLPSEFTKMFCVKQRPSGRDRDIS